MLDKRLTLKYIKKTDIYLLIGPDKKILCQSRDKTWRNETKVFSGSLYKYILVNKSLSLFGVGPINNNEEFRV